LRIAHKTTDLAALEWKSVCTSWPRFVKFDPLDRKRGGKELTFWGGQLDQVLLFYLLKNPLPFGLSSFVVFFFTI
jgi:hypothetical protein